MKDNVQVIITDSPLFFSSVYDETKCKALKQLIMKEYNGYKNLTYLLKRSEVVPYEQEGRYQDLEGAKKVDRKVKKFMEKNDIKFKTLKGIDADSLEVIVKDALKSIRKKNDRRD